MLALQIIPASFAFHLLFLGPLLGTIIAGLAFIRINRKAKVKETRDRWIWAAFYGALATIFIDIVIVGLIILINALGPQP